ncbi:MAG: GNAT family N-acetyltransferase [Chloroflexota bacterium]|nr:GNAT family N-acetyltransferase [Chloroflexota bacterium]
MATQPTDNAQLIRDLDDSRLIAALEENTALAYADCAREWPGEVDVTPARVRYNCGAPLPLFNGVASAQFAPETVDAQIAEALQPFRERRLPMMWWVGPLSRPAHLGERLLAHGLQGDGHTPGMALDLSALPPADATPPARLTIAPATTRETLEDWATISARVFGAPDALRGALLEMGVRQSLRPDPQWVYFLGRLDGRSVATSALFFGAGVAGVYNVATLPDARRLGIGAEMTGAALGLAQERGYHVSILQSSEMGYRVYEALGYRTVLTFDVYMFSGEID